MPRNLPLSRRTLLRGCGAALGLPLLEAMLPRAGAGAVLPQRLLVYFLPNGMVLPRTIPTQTGTNYVLPDHLSVLEPHRADLLVVSGLTNHPTDGEPHASAVGMLLTGTFISAQPSTGAAPTAATSMDQLAAAHLGPGTRLPSLELGSEGTFLCRFASGSESYCAYLNHLSWSSPTQPRSKEVSPRRAFERTFGAVGQGSPEERARRLLHERSVLDTVLADVADLEAVLGREDRARLDAYLTGVRELEQRLDAAENSLPPSCAAPAEELWTRLVNDPSADVTEHAELMSDLMVLALRCDATRVITYMLGNGRSERPFPFLGIDDTHHWLSHNYDIPQHLESLSAISRWEVARFEGLVRKLGEVQEVDGSRLLDHTAALMCCAFGDPGEHDTSEIPLVLAGGGAGLLPGRHVRFSGGPSINRLHLTLLQGLGAPVSAFGGATQVLPGLTA
jgi:hypothetical protein